MWTRGYLSPLRAVEEHSPEGNVYPGPGSGTPGTIQHGVSLLGSLETEQGLHLPPQRDKTPSGHHSPHSMI